MNIEHDYPELPILSEADQLGLENIAPRWFLLSTDELEENRHIRSAIRPLVARYVRADAVERVTENSMVAIRKTIEAAMNNQGDVTPSD